MKVNIYKFLLKEAEANKEKALLTLDLMSNHSVGIGDHSTEDFYKNAREALHELCEANEQIETIKSLTKND